MSLPEGPRDNHSIAQDPGLTQAYRQVGQTESSHHQNSVLVWQEMLSVYESEQPPAEVVAQWQAILLRAVVSELLAVYPQGKPRVVGADYSPLHQNFFSEAKQLLFALTWLFEDHPHQLYQLLPQVKLGNKAAQMRLFNLVRTGGREHIEPQLENMMVALSLVLNNEAVFATLDHLHHGQLTLQEAESQLVDQLK